MPQAPKNKMFALGFPDSEGNSFTQDSVSHDRDTLEARVQKEFETDKMHGEIYDGATLDRHVDTGDSSVITFRYEDEHEEPVLFAQIETVTIL